MALQGKPHRFYRPFLGSLRVAGYVFVASSLCAAFGARVVYADFQEASLQVGNELTGLNDVLGSTNTLNINGVAMHVSTAFTDESPTEVLDRFEGMCQEHPEMLVRALTDIPQALLAAHVKPAARFELGVVRKERNGRGALTCFTDDRGASIHDVVARLQSFVKTHDLAEFGRFRYVYVDRTDSGKTHVTTIWTNGRFNVGEMFPATGDAPGFDSTMVPRPPGAKRILSGAAAGQPFGVRIYESSRSEAEIRAFYAAQMPSDWKLVADKPSAHALAYLKTGGAVLYLTVQPKGDGTVVTLTETTHEAAPRDAVAAGAAANPGEK